MMAGWANEAVVNGKRLCVFFFSSRRRHTRSLRDWSSDVCSSDLIPVAVHVRGEDALAQVPARIGEARRERRRRREREHPAPADRGREIHVERAVDRKSTRLNSSHVEISYAVFCLKKKKKTKHQLI